MWTSTIDLDLKRIAFTRLLGRIWPDVYFSSFATLRVQNVARASLAAPNWVRVRNRLAGVCGSDLHFVYSNGDLRIAPAALPGSQRMYPGHELLGEVIEVGEEAQHLHVGDRVVLQHGPSCVSAGLQPLCHSCAAANFALCERGAFPEPQQIGGGWSEEMLLHESRLYRVAPDVSDEQAMMIEPAAVALHAILRRPPQAGEKVLIIGAGTIGLLTLQIVHALVPQIEISVLARHPFQVEQATRMGATHIIYDQDSYAGVQRATQARLYRGLLGNKMLLGGYDIIFDTVGRQQTLHHALRWAKARGTVVLVGLDLRFMHIDLSPIWYREVNLSGTFGHGIEHWPLSDIECPRSTFSIIEELILQEKIHPEQLITHRFAINHYREALQTAHSKSQSRAIKVAFDYSLVPATVVPNVRASARKPRSSTRTSITFDDIAWEEDDYQPIRPPDPVTVSTSDQQDGSEAQPVVYPVDLASNPFAQSLVVSAQEATIAQSDDEDTVPVPLAAFVEVSTQVEEQRPETDEGEESAELEEGSTQVESLTYKDALEPDKEEEKPVSATNSPSSALLQEKAIHTVSEVSRPRTNAKKRKRN